MDTKKTKIDISYLFSDAAEELVGSSRKEFADKLDKLLLDLKEQGRSDDECRLLMACVGIRLAAALLGAAAGTSSPPGMSLFRNTRYLNILANAELYKVFQGE